jgi:RNA polymerase sigma-54 factor
MATGPSLSLDVYQDEYQLQDMRPKVSARLVAASSMLELTSQALHETIERELEENPALEAEEVDTCQTCGTPLQGSICPTCLRMQRSELPEELDDYGDERALSGGEPEDDFDPLSIATTREPLADQLFRELCLHVPRDDRAIAEQLVFNLDERGYLATSVEEIADRIDVDVARVQAVLSSLQTLDPVGVGARDVRECLLIQLDALEAQGVECRVAREIVSNYMSDLATRKLDRIAKRLKVDEKQVEEAAAFIRERLNPFPARAHDEPQGPSDSRSVYRMPDVVIAEVEGKFVVEVVEARKFELRVAAAYEQLARTKDGVSNDDRTHVVQYATRAKLFIQNIAQRRQTIRRVTEALAAAQADFLRHGVRHLKPLTRQHIAATIGLDESTVSRATNGKSVLLPSGKVVDFDTFFTPALAIHDVMREIVEQSGRPLTDSELRDALAERGINIARRTVAKYRGRAGIPASILRAA